MANQWIRRLRTVVVCGALLSLTSTASATDVAIEDPALLPEPKLDTKWLSDDGDPFFIWLWDRYDTGTYGETLCGIATETLLAALGAEASGTEPDPTNESGLDPLKYHECREVRDESQQALYSELGIDSSGSYECYWPHAPGWGPAPYKPLTPFSVCVGQNQWGCDVMVQTFATTCLNGIFPE